ncbi:hypothetical protein EIZ62_21660 [Streptomyces ficellus]|uniref:Secreted protein n=2 Tax=Streptomyces ficellus TaxID=1977088 RepID=A0A6I6FK48_9ACTN|nr:hypothetical protein EIZ62_21660 [Streptomyces ficellus]
MARARRLLVQMLAVLVAAGFLVLGGPGAPRADAAVTACSGRLVKTVKFSTGELRVYKKRQYACALTVAKKPGARRAMSVSIQPRGGRAAVDVGAFTRQAGPVTVYALNRCVRASGTVAGRGGSTGWILC